MKSDQCNKCRNRVLLVIDKDINSETLKWACRFGEKPDTCVEFRWDGPSSQEDSAILKSRLEAAAKTQRMDVGAYAIKLLARECGRTHKKKE